MTGWRIIRLYARMFVCETYRTPDKCLVLKLTARALQQRRHKGPRIDYFSTVERISGHHLVLETPSGEA